MSSNIIVEVLKPGAFTHRVSLLAGATVQDALDQVDNNFMDTKVDWSQFNITIDGRTVPISSRVNSGEQIMCLKPSDSGQ